MPNPRYICINPSKKNDSFPLSRDSSTIFFYFWFRQIDPIWVRDPYPEFLRIQFRIHWDIKKEHKSSGVRDSAVKASAVSETPPIRHQRYRADAATKISVKIISVSDTADDQRCLRHCWYSISSSVTMPELSEMPRHQQCLLASLIQIRQRWFKLWIVKMYCPCKGTLFLSKIYHGHIKS